MLGARRRLQCLILSVFTLIGSEIFVPGSLIIHFIESCLYFQISFTTAGADPTDNKSCSQTAARKEYKDEAGLFQSAHRTRTGPTRSAHRTSTRSGTWCTVFIRVSRTRADSKTG